MHSAHPHIYLSNYEDEPSHWPAVPPIAGHACINKFPAQTSYALCMVYIYTLPYTYIYAFGQEKAINKNAFVLINHIEVTSN